MSETIPAYQSEIVEEKSALDAKIAALEEFVASDPVFVDLPQNEQFLIRSELDYRKSLSAIMAQRISFFPLPSE